MSFSHTSAYSLSVNLLHAITRFVALVSQLRANCCISCSYILQCTIPTTQVYSLNASYQSAYMQLGAPVARAMVSQKLLACSTACRRPERNTT